MDSQILQRSPQEHLNQGRVVSYLGLLAKPELVYNLSSQPPFSCKYSQLRALYSMRLVLQPCQLKE